MKFGKFVITEDQIKEIFGLDKETVIINAQLNELGELEFTTCTANPNSEDGWGEYRSTGLRRKPLKLTDK